MPPPPCDAVTLRTPQWEGVELPDGRWGLWISEDDYFDLLEGMEGVVEHIRCRAAREEFLMDDPA